MFEPLDSIEKSGTQTISGVVLLHSDIISVIVLKTPGKVLAFRETHSAKVFFTKKKLKMEQDACDSCQISLFKQCLNQLFSVSVERESESGTG